ncbi:hypothetical protein BHE74_00056606, partial [Ensete ventricosum]
MTQGSHISFELASYQGLQFRSAGQSVSIRQVTTTRTARYRLVPPKSTVGGRFRPSMVDCAPTGKRSHKERLSTVEARLDVLETSLEELYQGQGRLLGVESSQEEAESRIDRVESLVDRLTEDTKDFVRHLHEVVAELTAKKKKRKRGKKKKKKRRRKKTSFPRAILARGRFFKV